MLFRSDALGIEAKISKICVRDAGRQRDFTVPDGCAIVTDVSEVLDDEAVELVVEVMGGTDLAKTVVTSALASGKHVVTANKALIAAHLPELNALVATVNADRADKVRFGYEAAVCGGIPIIHALQRDLLGDSVTQLSGIINGSPTSCSAIWRAAASRTTTRWQRPPGWAMPRRTPRST